LYFDVPARRVLFVFDRFGAEAQPCEHAPQERVPFVQVHYFVADLPRFDPEVGGIEIQLDVSEQVEERALAAILTVQPDSGILCPMKTLPQAGLQTHVCPYRPQRDCLSVNPPRSPEER